jgi:hypothetical protein
MNNDTIRYEVLNYDTWDYKEQQAKAIYLAEKMKRIVDELEEGTAKELAEEALRVYDNWQA